MTGPAQRRGHVSARVIGLGNRYRGDDEVGLRVADRLRSLVPEGTTVRTHSGEPLDLVEGWAGGDLVIVVDAVRSGGDPGFVHRVEWGKGALPSAGTTASTHALDLAQTIELGRTLGLLPRRLIVWGVEGTRFGMGEEPGAAVLAAVPEVVAGVLRDLTGSHPPVS